jgi:thiamine biosynthesis lipoprotein
MSTLTLARHAMATRFELVLHGENPVALRAAGEEALAEIERLEERLSLFRSSSEIAHLNARAVTEAVRVTPEVFGLLERAQRLSHATGGAFDITIAPLVRCWGFHTGRGVLPEPEELAEARTKVGMHLVQLDAKEFTVRFARPGVMLDLGAIGKGYAIERAAELLREAGVSSALLHGGTSTVYALGRAPEEEFWRVAVDYPDRTTGGQAGTSERQPEPAEAGVPQTFAIKGGRESEEKPNLRPALTTILLKDEALSVSAIWGKYFRSGAKMLGHIIDPRTGEPAQRAVLAAVVLPSATETDALSTALLTLGPEGHEQIARLRQGMRTLVVAEADDGFRCEASGIAVEPLA